MLFALLLQRKTYSRKYYKQIGCDCLPFCGYISLDTVLNGPGPRSNEQSTGTQQWTDGLFGQYACLI